ncbi:MAG: hypothetical protein V4722_09550 [Bacteroidota bacterium]
MKNTNPVLIILAAVMAAGCGSKIVKRNLVIKEMNWEYVVYLEELKTVQKETWADQLPENAKRISERIVPKGTNTFIREETYTEKEKYICGTEHYGTATYQTRPQYCEREVTRKRSIMGILPEDRVAVTYELKEWQEAGKDKAYLTRGTDLQTPAFSETKPAGDTIRTGRKTAFYAITLAGTDPRDTRTYETTLSAENFAAYKRGQLVTAEFWDEKSEQPLSIRPVDKQP